MHIKWVLNWDFKYPQQFNESWGSAGTAIRTRAQMIKVTVEASEKAISNSECINEGTFFSMSNQNNGRRTFRNSRSPENNVRPQR